MLADSPIDTYANKLSRYSPTTARLEAIMLLENVTKKDRSYLLAHPEMALDDIKIATMDSFTKRRLSGEPMAYILGRKEFYGRNFLVTPDVLIPRPESETIIELLLKHYNDNTVIGKKLLDVGTGSGCLAITAKLELPKLDVYACDISKAALGVANENAAALNASIELFESDLLKNTHETYDLIVANLPYVPKNLQVSRDVLAEPMVAVFSGDDGLIAIRRLLKQCPTRLSAGGMVIIESLEIQHSEVINLAEECNLKLIEPKGLIQVFQL